MASSTTHWFRKFLFSIGSISYGVKDTGFNTLLMLFYNQVLGLPAIYVGIAMLIVLVADAFTDPYVGHLSDNWKSRFGRRHVFMYWALIPMGLSYIFIWFPPDGLTEMQLFFYLVVSAMFVRILITFYDVPNTAMIAELETDYDRRTGLNAMRQAFGHIGGVVIGIIAFLVFLVPTEAQPIGQLNKQGYQDFAVLAAIVMAGAGFISALGTHSLIPSLPQPTERTSVRPKAVLRRFSDAFGLDDFKYLFVTMMLILLIQGVTLTLQIYYATYYFELTSQQTGLLALSMLPGALLAMFLTPIVCKNRDKKRVALSLIFLQLIVANFSITAFLFGFLPSNNTGQLLPILFINLALSAMISVALQIVLMSMISDLIEKSEKEFGYRPEGLYFAAFSFGRKVLSGMGIFVSGVLIFSFSTQGSQLQQTDMIAVTYGYLPIMVILHFASAYFVRSYSLSREEHLSNLKSVKMI